MIASVRVRVTVLDLALAGLLIGVSGFVFGGGPHGMHSAFRPAVALVAVTIPPSY